jgi:hypothetical protein
MIVALVVIVIPVHHSVTATTVQHAQAAETSVAAMTAHHAAIVTHAHHSVTATTVQHAQAAETSVAAMTAHHVVQATTVHHVDHALIHAEAAQPVLVAHQQAVKNQHVVTSPLVQSVRLNQ